MEPMTFRPFEDISELDEVAEQARADAAVDRATRITLLSAGASMGIVAGLVLKKSWPCAAGLAAVGAVLAYAGTRTSVRLPGIPSLLMRGASGESGVPGNNGINVEQSVTIKRPREAVFSFCRNVENFSKFLGHVESVRKLDDRRSHWIVKAPAGQTVEWDAEIVNEHRNELIAWQSLPGAEVQNAGSLRFESTADGGTQVKVSLQYLPPAGILGAIVARLFGEAPEQQLQDDLARMKELLEKHA